MKKKLICGVLFLVTLVMLCGCGNSSKDIVGKWHNEDCDIEFFDDGTCDVTDVTMAYGQSKYSFLDENRIKFELYLGKIRIYKYKLDGNTLILKSEDRGTVEELTRSVKFN